MKEVRSSLLISSNIQIFIKQMYKKLSVICLFLSVSLTVVVGVIFVFVFTLLKVMRCCVSSPVFINMSFLLSLFYIKMCESHTHWYKISCVVDIFFFCFVYCVDVVLISSYKREERKLKMLPAIILSLTPLFTYSSFFYRNSKNKNSA